MFSEYASRFLAQSQSRISFGQPNNTTASRNPLDRRRGPTRFPPSRSYQQRPNRSSPYQASGSQLSRFPFASRAAAPPAPLFYSATDDFREEDDNEEHEREVADFYALQQSRRQFGNSHLTESTDDDDRSRGSQIDEVGDGGDDAEEQGLRKGRGIRSSWRGGASREWARTDAGGGLQTKDQSEAASESSGPSSKGKGRLVDVELASTMHDSLDIPQRQGAASEIAADADDEPPAFQQFRSPPAMKKTPFIHSSAFLAAETDEQTAFAKPRPPSPDIESVPATIAEESLETPRHDSFWATLYFICLLSVFATFVLVYLHTSAPNSHRSLGDTIYTTLHSSFYLLAVDTLISVIVALLWLAILRQFVRPLVLGILVAVPIVLFSFSLYPLISSYKGPWHGGSIQDKAMRWLSLLPGIAVVLWTYTVLRARHSLNRATEILEFTCKILAASPGLIAVGLCTLAAVVLWTWLWMGMFTRIFLSGHFSSAKHLFILDSSTWWLGAFFVLVYLWTLGIIAGLQRATTAATVSQWYFHRLTIPAPSSRKVVQASLSHATSTAFGTICLSTLLSLLIRLPLLILPRRLAGLVILFTYSLFPTPLATLTNPLTLTFAAIHSQPLASSARGLANMRFISATSPTTTLTPSSLPPSSSTTTTAGSPLLPYRLAKLLLHATRFVTALSLGFGAWVSTARTLSLTPDTPDAGAGYRGSLYAYVVGLLAGAIGWGVLGAMEGVLGGVLDAVVVCWGSEAGLPGRRAGYCREAGELFGEEGDRGGYGDEMRRGMRLA